MEWTTYALIAAGSLGFISLVMGLIESLVWRRWDREQRAQHLAWLEDEARTQRLLARSLQAELGEVRANYGSQLERAMLDGYEKGFADGHEQTPEYEAAFTDGYDEGHADGYEEGKREGYFLGVDIERSVWTTNLSDDADPFGMERPLGVYDEPDNGDPEVLAWLNASLAEGPSEAD